jgi:hypothetical protein
MPEEKENPVSGIGPLAPSFNGKPQATALCNSRLRLAVKRKSLMHEANMQASGSQ